MTRTGHGLRALVLAVTYLGVMIFAGHGVGPVGLLLWAGSAPEYMLPMAAGWLGITALVLSVVLPPRYRRAAAWISAALISVSWLAFLAVSEWKLATFATSIPLLAALAWILRSKTNQAAKHED